jgi:hypothetical protein
VGSAGRIPSRLVCETNLPEGRDRKIPTDLNQKTKTKNHCVLGTKLRLEQGRPRHFGKITICPTKDRDIINNPFNYTEMLEKSGQSLSPCVEVNGHMLADVNGDEVEAYLLEAGVLHLTAGVADAPANWACDAHHHE